MAVAQMAQHDAEELGAFLLYRIHHHHDTDALGLTIIGVVALWALPAPCFHVGDSVLISVACPRTSSLTPYPHTKQVFQGRLSLISPASNFTLATVQTELITVRYCTIHYTACVALFQFPWAALMRLERRPPSIDTLEHQTVGSL